MQSYTVSEQGGIFHFKQLSWAMKINFFHCLFMTLALVLNGCTQHPHVPSNADDKKSGLFMVNGQTICQEVLSSKMWQSKKEGPFSSLEEADRYATELELDGYDDWRLPTRSELFDIFYMHYFQNDGDCVMNHRGEFWALSGDQEPSLGHWEDDLLCGPEFKFVESMKDYGFVRAIRP